MKEEKEVVEENWRNCWTVPSVVLRMYYGPEEPRWLWRLTQFLLDQYSDAHRSQEGTSQGLQVAGSSRELSLDFCFPWGAC